MKNFKSLGLSQTLLRSLDYLKFSAPTEIQSKAIPVAMSGRDILASASTGTGKTVAFSVPVVEKVLSTKGTALIIAPTRELAAQVLKSVRDLLGPRYRNETALLIGGEFIGRQLKQLRYKPKVIVGTPGRISDHFSRGTLDLSKVGTLVLDETDRMLDMGFSIQIDEIVKNIPDNRQTLLFSATIPEKIKKVAERYLKEYERIEVGIDREPVKSVKREIVNLKLRDKYGVLCEQLDKREGSIIVFVNTKSFADRIASSLTREGYKAEAIHGDLQHRKRERVLSGFRKKHYRILVATDIASRGIDVPHVEHVINFDLPNNPEDYIHRIGRTGRAGSSGESLCFITEEEKRTWQAIQHFLEPDKHPKPSAKRMHRNKNRRTGRSSGRNRKKY